MIYVQLCHLVGEILVNSCDVQHLLSKLTISEALELIVLASSVFGRNYGRCCDNQSVFRCYTHCAANK